MTTPLSGLTQKERNRFVLSTLGFMCVASAALIARTVGDALFLTQHSLGHLSYMYIGTAVVVSLAAFAYGIGMGKMPLGKLIAWSCLLLISALLALRLSLTHPWGGSGIVAYFLSDLLVNLPMMLFWTFAAMIFNPREAKRLFGFVGAGGTVACILSGFLIRPFIALLGTENLLFVIAALLGGFLGTVNRLTRHDGLSLPPSSGSNSPTFYSSLLSTPQVRALVFLVLAVTLTLTLVDYQFKAGARLHYQGQALAGFFGNFYALSSVVALFIQLFLVHRILQKGGILLGLAILPAGLLIATVGTLLTASFAWIVATKFVVQICLFTVDIAALQMLYLGVPKQSRSQARAFIDGIGKPVAIAGTGVGLVAIVSHIPLHTLAIGGIVFALLWLWSLRSNHKAYVSALMNSLGTHHLDIAEETSSFRDKTFEAHIRQALQTASDTELAYLLGILTEMDHIDWSPEFRQLLGREPSDVKISALHYLQDRGNEDDLPSFKRHLEHEDPQVRAASIYACASLGGSETVEELEGCLEDPHPIVRAAAIATLINSGDLDLLLNAGVVLKAMLQSKQSQDRIAACDALAHIQHADLIRPLVGLLQDPDEAVRLSALEACRIHPSPKLVPAIIPLLADPGVAIHTAETLATYGSEILDHLLPYLELKDMEGAFEGAHHIPPILAKVGDLKSLSVLKEIAQSSDLVLRKRAIEAFGTLLQSAPSIKPYLPDLQALIQSEIDAATQHYQVLCNLENVSGSALLNDALQEAYDSHLSNVFRLLDTAFPDVGYQTIFKGLVQSSPESRANALEILDNVLDKSLKPDLLSLLESSPNTRVETSIEQTIQTLIDKQTPEWLTSGALMATVENRWDVPDRILLECMDHPSPIVRETLLFTLDQLAAPETVQQACHRLEQDPDPAVRRLVQSLRSEPPTEASPSK